RGGRRVRGPARFPDNAPLRDVGPTPKAGVKTDEKVVVERKPPATPDGQPDTEIQTMHLAKVEGSWATFEGLLTRTPEGKYRFWLSSPEVKDTGPGGTKPSAEATVVLPPGELDRLRMNRQEMEYAAEVTQGRFYTLDRADQLLDELPSGVRVALNTPRPPKLLWNHWLMFLLVVGLLLAEWLLRKRKHLL